MKSRTWIVLAIVALFSISTAGAQGPEKIGRVKFPISCAAAVQKPFERGVALLHSFWYLEAAKAFTEITQAEPDCAIAYWGLAMTNWTQIWSPPQPAALKRGWEAIEKAKAATARTPKERDFVAAAEAFFKDGDKADHRTRAVAYGRAMEHMAQRYPDDIEVLAFYALSLQAVADPKDKTYASQKRSAELAEKIFVSEPDHPGAAHYMIHGYDYPPLAQQGLPAARRYALFAPSVPHALHMPSHIYVLLGMWPDTVRSNIAAAAAEKARGNPDDHMHALDYLVYGYLQMAQDAEAKKVVDEARAIMADLAAKKYDSGRPTAHFAMAAIEARWALERGQWAEAAAIDPRPNRFPHTESMVYLARAIGAARTGNGARARADVDRLAALKDSMKDAYWAEQIEIQRRAAAAWAARAEGKAEEGFALMRSAVELEASTEKHNITPGPIVTARELLGDMLLEANQPGPAGEAYEASLRVAPNRFKALHGVARAAERAGDRERAKTYYGKLLATAAAADTPRPELQEAKAFK
jgi:predicted hotdog family 3-hydroxylacyl-ACP dehydratase